MADEEFEESEIGELDDEELTEEEKEAIGKGSFSLKTAIPVFLVEAVIAYFIASYVIVPMLISDVNAEVVESHTTSVSDSIAAVNDSIARSYNEIGPILAVDDIIVNPSGTDGERLIVLNISFELWEDGLLEECIKREPLIRDIAIGLISGLPVDSLDGAANKIKLKNALATELKRVLPKDAIKRIYFTSFIIQ
ncbi:MAG: flagellar basal body-associated FliL family protein [Calditrichia bacterium]|nr:flagellar basal body-associated FliL family protein [Calditrichia bacterium]